MTTDLKAAALEYARRGWYVFPLTPGTKIPPAGTAGHLDASVDLAIVDAWWERTPDANIGIAVAPSGLMVLDVDTNDGKHGAASLATIDKDLTVTLTARTGRGGIHGLYSRPADMAAERRIDVLPGIDIIGDGYIVAAPSRLTAGGTYTWISTSPIAPMPEVMRTLRKVRPAAIEPGESAPKIKEGGRNAAMFRLGAGLRGQGLEGDALKSAMHFTNRDRVEPPLPDDEVESIYHKVLRHARVDRDALYGAVIAQDLAALYPQMATAALPGDATVIEIPEAATVRDLLPRLMADARLPIVHLPFAKLDDKLGGLQLHSNTVLIAPPGKGKTSLAGQIGVHHARSHGPVIVYVGEMTRQLWMARVAGGQLGRSWLEVLTGKVPEHLIDKAIGDLPILFVGRCDHPMQAIARACARAAALGWTGTPMLIIDYVQLLAAPGKDARLAMIESFRELQHFVEQCPVVALDLSQTSRPGATKIRGGTERAEDLADTGAESAEIERGATNILVLSYQSKDDATEHDVTMAVGKGRFGGGSKFGFIFNGVTGLWTPTDKPPVSEDHEQRCAEVMSQIMIHHAGKCLGGSQPCGRDINVASFIGAASKNPHKVQGSKDEITRAVEDLIDMRRIVKMGSVLMLLK